MLNLKFIFLQEILEILYKNTRDIYEKEKVNMLLILMKVQILVQTKYKIQMKRIILISKLMKIYIKNIKIQ